MGTVRVDLRIAVAEVLERIDDIKDPAIRNVAINGVLNTLDDLIKTIQKEIK